MTAQIWLTADVSSLALRVSARLFSDPARSGRKTSGRASARVPAERDGFLDGGQRPGPVPAVGLPTRQVIQRRGQVGEEEAPGARW